MGRCYDSRGRLCCDKCDEAGNVRRRPCPSNYCPSADLCPKCWAEVRASGKWSTWHVDCPARHAEFVAQEARKTAALEAGAFLRVAAMGRTGMDAWPGGLVQVCFRNREGLEEWCATSTRLPAGSFREAGTRADVVLVTVRR